MIGLLLVDDHLPVRRGLEALLRGEPGLVPLASVSEMEQALVHAAGLRPDVAIVDYHLPDGDGLALCMRLKALPAPPHVLIYSAFASAGLIVPAVLAGADGLLDKGVRANDLFDTIRLIARGERVLPSTPPHLMAASAERVRPEDLPILGMLMEGTSRTEMADVLQVDEHALNRRVEAMVRTLKPATHDLSTARHERDERDERD